MLALYTKIMLNKNKEYGVKAENIAKIYLAKNCYKVLHSNWTCRWGEIDIIAQKNEVTIFFEVKYRSSLKFGLPEDALTYHKKRALYRSIRKYLFKNNIFDEKWRLDIICILAKSLKHYKSVELA